MTTFHSLPPPSRRDTIYSLKLESSDDLIEFQISQFPPSRRPRTAGSSHYRPHSVVAEEQRHYNLSRTRSFYKPKTSSLIRPLSIMGFGAKKDESPAAPPPTKVDRQGPTLGRLGGSTKSKKKHPFHLLSVSETVLPQIPSPVGPLLHQNHNHRASKFFGVPLVEREDECTTKPSTERLFWTQKNGQLLHPFSSDGVPYMVAYDGVLVQNDRYTTSLLHRLNPYNSPSFYDYGRKPPKTVLDLGCGDMHWAEQAAIAWKAYKTQITAFDLINAPAMLRKSDHPIPDNVQFVQGNFIHNPLPFHDNTFDMVRLACLSLAIPHQRWKPILIEVQRVLKPGGRVEIIDDQMIFPYGFSPCWAPLNRYSTISATSEGSATFSIPGRPSTAPSRSATHPAPPTRPIPAPPVSPSRSSVILSAAPPSGDWDTHANLSKDLESIFNAMLIDEYGIHPEPHTFLLQTLGDIFGKSKAREVCCLELKLAPSSEVSKDADRYSLESSDSGYFSSTSTKNWFNSDRELKDNIRKLHKNFDKTKVADKETNKDTEGKRYNEPTLTTVAEKELPPLPPGMCSSDSLASPASRCRTTSIDSFRTYSTDRRISVKAADRLGIDIETLTAAASVIAEKRRLSFLSEPAQSPGLILSPSTFIPFGPAELEMHVCKHMHTLLGCKSALTDYIARQVDEQGQRFLESSELDDALWKYECFRRTRFNWPPTLPTEDDPVATKQPQSYSTAPGLTNRLRSGSGSRQSVAWRSANSQEMTHVRTFRIFEATKLS